MIYKYPVRDEVRKETAENDHSTCHACAKKGIRCSGNTGEEEPCIQCLQAKELSSFCNWTTPEGNFVKVPTLAWLIDCSDVFNPTVRRDPDLPRDVTIKDLQRGGSLSRRARRKRGMDRFYSKKRLIELTRLVDRRDDDSHDDDDGVSKDDNRHRISLSTHTLDASESSSKFAQMNPFGYLLIATQGDGLHCCLYAIVHSLQALRNSGVEVPVPTYADLLATSQSDEYVARVTELQIPAFLNNNNYHVDQGALIVQMWAERTHNFPLRMGYITPNQRPYLLPYAPLHEGIIDSDPQIFFIHNNNAVASNPRARGILNHFEGIKAARMGIQDDGNEDDDSYSQSGNDDSEDDDEESFKPLNGQSNSLNPSQPPNLPSGPTAKSIETLRSFAHTFSALTLTELATLPDPQTYTEAMRMPDRQNWIEAMQVEYDSLMKKGTWIVVDSLPEDRKALTTRFVYKRKLGPDGKIVKW